MALREEDNSRLEEEDEDDDRRKEQVPGITFRPREMRNRSEEENIADKKRLRGHLAKGENFQCFDSFLWPRSGFGSAVLGKSQ